MRLVICYLMLAFFLITPKVQASEQARIFLEGVRLYKENRYAEAASQFSKIADTIQNSRLYYNLGNAYLKSDNLGQAILWYERAMKLNPNDPDLKFNYEYALSLIKDEKGDNEISLFRILFFWKFLLSDTTVQKIAIILNAVWWSLLTVQSLLKKRFRMLNTVILMITAVFMLTAFYNYYEANYLKEAVILPAEIPVRSGLSDDSTQLFVLHAGTKVRVEKESGDHFRIYFSEGKIGWIKKADAGVI